MSRSLALSLNGNKFTQMRVFRRKSFIFIHRIIKHLNQTMKFELLFKIKTCTCFLTKVNLIFKKLLEKIYRMDLQLIMLPLFLKIIVWLNFWMKFSDIDKTRFVGITTTLKNLISLDNSNLLNFGWSCENEITFLYH